MDAAIQAHGLRKRFGKMDALAGIDLAVPPGTICGLLGPNGAGKTTAVRVLATLLRPDAGTASVAGHDVLRESQQVRHRIGLAGQYAAVDELLSGRTNLRMFGRLYHLPGKLARRRADELLDRFALTDAANRPVKTYSGGMRRRLDLAASLITSPDVLFLDEPTTGIDPGARLAIWDMISDLVAEGTTVLLTTQYLDEADRLADHIVVLHHGQVVASGSPATLKSAIGGQRIDLAVRDKNQLGRAAAALGASACAEPTVNIEQGRVSAPVTTGPATLTHLIRTLDDEGIEIDDIALRHPTLDEVFLRLTGDGAPAGVPDQKNAQSSPGGGARHLDTHPAWLDHNPASDTMEANR